MFCKYSGGWINLEQVTAVDSRKEGDDNWVKVYGPSSLVRLLAWIKGEEADRFRELLNRASVWDLGEEVKPMQGWPTYDTEQLAEERYINEQEMWGPEGRPG